MALLKLNKNNAIDLAAAAVVCLLVAIGSLYYLHKPEVETTKLSVTVEVSDSNQVAAISGEAAGSKTVYLNSINIPVSAVTSMQGSDLHIVVLGPGHTDGNGFYYFSDQRLLVGQKAEIHGSYFAQGKIIKIEDAK